MPEVIEIGGLALNGMLLTALIAAFAGYGSLWLWTVRARESRSGPWGDLTAGAALLAVVIWKFGVLFREPSLLWEQPLLLLVIVGSGAEAFAGLAAAGLYWIWQARRRGVGLLRALDALAVSAAGGLLAWNLLSAIEYRWGYAAVCAALLALLIGRRAPATAPDAGSAAETMAGTAAGTTGEETAGAVNAAGNSGAADEAEGDAGGPVTSGAMGVAGSAGWTSGGGAAGLNAGPDRNERRRGDGDAAVLAGYVLGAGCLAVSLFAEPAPWVRPPELAGLTSTQLVFIAAGLAAAALDAYRDTPGRRRNGR